MPSVPSSPVAASRTPYHRFSHSDAFSSSASSIPYQNTGTRSSRRSSRTSQTSINYSPTTPRQTLDRRKSGAPSIGSDGYYDASRPEEGLGNLADELADAWDEEGGEPDSAFLEGLREAQSPATPSRTSTFSEGWPSPTRSNGRMGSPTKLHGRGNSRSGMPVPNTPTELEGLGIIPDSLGRALNDLDNLASQSLNSDSVSEGGGVISRTLTALQDLGPQASIEAGTTRITAAYNSVANHRIQVARQILSTAQSVLLHRIFTLSEPEIDGLLSGIDQLNQDLQLPSTSGPSPLQSLQAVMGSTADLIRSLRCIADNVQESRQVTTVASRRLKAVRDFVSELKQEEEAREQGVRYLEQGEWSHRLRCRQAANSCGDIVAGFERACDKWRERLAGLPPPASMAPA